MKTAKFSNLINALNYHNNNGGLYTVLTPSYIYRDCILLRVSDVNSTIDGSSQFQSVWRFDFIQSLVSNAKSKVVLKHDKTDMDIGCKNILISWIGTMTMEKYQFTPDNNADPPYQITINMDNKDYIFRVMYNLYSQRWYFSISDLQQNVIKIAPLISSTENRDINLTFNIFFNNSLVFRNDQNMIMVK